LIYFGPFTCVAGANGVGKSNLFDAIVFLKSLMELPIADKAIPIVPVRMQEAWLLFDESAIRLAAGNPNGNVALSIPPLARLESLPNPKALLHDLLVTATEYKGRPRKGFNPSRAAARLGEILDDFSPLRALPAFEDTERRIVQALAQLFPEIARKA